MQIHRSAVGLVAHTPAKLNLFFEVLGQRDDGYHEIETLMVPVQWYDSLYFREDRSGQVELEFERAPGCGGPSGYKLGDVPEGKGNLVVRAVELLRRRSGVSFGASLRLVKRIPAAAGLGGGSSDAAAALVLANRGWGLGWSRPALAELAAELGSDVPFFLVSGPAVCRGRGERVEPVAGFGALCFVVVRPPVGLSTADVYRVCQAAERPRALAPLLTALADGNLAVAGRLLHNRLQPAAETLSPWIRRLREAMACLDVLGHQMSGSGTCYFGLCRHAGHARRLARRLQASGVGTVFAVRGCR
jgi:4-diphosphocytidyl-2-C-methyl-D-erythritol kinase